MAQQIHLAMPEDLLAETIASQVSSKKLNEMFPNYHGCFPAVLSIPFKIGKELSLPKEEIHEILTWLQPYTGMVQSNNWAVAPEQTVTQATPLAHDSHLELSVPDFFYEAYLQTPELEITGSLVPGLTFLVSSHNIKIAWGMISLHANAGDYWTEKLSPNGKHVKIKGPQEPLLVREERSKVRWSGHSSCVKPLMGQLSINFFSRPTLRIF